MAEMLIEDLVQKWTPILEHKDLDSIKDRVRRNTTAVVLENTEKALASSGNPLNESGPTNATGSGVANYNPIMISLVRRAMPNLIAYDICGVQPMTGPTGLVFAMRSRYTSQSGAENFYNEVDTGMSARGAANTDAVTAGYASATAVGGATDNVGTVPGSANNAGNNTYNFAGGLATSVGEGLGSNTTAIFPQMAFTIEQMSVTATERALKAEYSIELAQDLKAIHGLDAETELSNILSSELLADINREVVRTILVTAKTGSSTGTTTNAGYFNLDTDSNGRWSVEKYKGLMMQIEIEANQIAKETRRGRGNVIICSSNVASALTMAGFLDTAPALQANQLQVDDTGNTFAGILNGRYKVYIDPYTTGDYMVIGYRGPNPWDAGIFYCPYVPLQMVRAVDPNTFQPKIGFKTRYGMLANPFAQGLTVGGGALVQDSNVYYRRTIVQNVL